MPVIFSRVSPAHWVRHNSVPALFPARKSHGWHFSGKITGNIADAYHDGEDDRLPYSLSDYLPDGPDEVQAIAIHQQFMQLAGNADLSAERIMALVSSVARSMDMLSIDSWPDAVGFYLKNAESRLPAPEPHPADPFNLLHALVGIIAAARPSRRPRLDQTIEEMEAALDVVLNRDTLAIHTSDSSVAAAQSLEQRWHEKWSESLGPVMRRWLQAEFSISLFPFAGPGETLTQRITILGVRFATTKLALMAACHTAGNVAEEPEMVRAIQSIARLLDHLADPALSLQIYEETGWVLEARLRSLVGDIS